MCVCVCAVLVDSEAQEKNTVGSGAHLPMVLGALGDQFVAEQSRSGAQSWAEGVQLTAVFILKHGFP